MRIEQNTWFVDLGLLCIPFTKKSPSEQCEAVEERDSTRASMRRRLSSSCLMLQEKKQKSVRKAVCFSHVHLKSNLVKIPVTDARDNNKVRGYTLTFETTRSCHLRSRWFSKHLPNSLSLPYFDSCRLKISIPVDSTTVGRPASIHFGQETWGLSDRPGIFKGSFGSPPHSGGFGLCVLDHDLFLLWILDIQKEEWNSFVIYVIWIIWIQILWKAWGEKAWRPLDVISSFSGVSC